MFGFLPFAGEVQDAVAGITGYDLVTSKKLSETDQLVSGGATFVPFVGGSLLKRGDDVVEGIYEFVAKTGDDYVGQSSNVSNRLKQHVKTGKTTEEGAANAKAREVKGGKTTREIEEQKRIDDLGGVEKLENVRNPIGPNHRHLVDDKNKKQ